MSVLFVNNQLNYFEALRRMYHWIGIARIATAEAKQTALGRIELLRAALVKNADNLYMEDK